MNKFEEWYETKRGEMAACGSEYDIAALAWDAALDVSKKEIIEDACVEDQQGTDDAIGSMSRCYSDCE